MGIFGSETLPKIPKPLISPPYRFGLRHPVPLGSSARRTWARRPGAGPGAGPGGRRLWDGLGSNITNPLRFIEKLS